MCNTFHTKLFVSAFLSKLHHNGFLFSSQPEKGFCVGFRYLSSNFDVNFGVKQYNPLKILCKSAVSFNLEEESMEKLINSHTGGTGWEGRHNQAHGAAVLQHGHGSSGMGNGFFCRLPNSIFELLISGLYVMLKKECSIRLFLQKYVYN